MPTVRRHSKAAGAAASRGGFTSVDAASFSPNTVGSLSPGGKSIDVRFMSSAMASSTRLTTNSPVMWMLRVVSLGEPSALCCRPSTMSAGFSENTLKNENGAALTTPSGLSVDTSAIGRGTTRPHSSL